MIEFASPKREKTSALDLSGLGIESLPADIAQLVHLEKLDLSYNRLADLPASIGRLVGLGGWTSAITGQPRCPRRSANSPNWNSFTSDTTG